MAALGDLQRRPHELAPVRLEDPLHLLRGLEVELLVGEAEAPRVRQLVARLDAEQHLVRVGVLGPQVVHVARADQRQAGLVGELQQPHVHLLVLLEPGVLQLDVHRVAPVDLHQPVELHPGARVVVLQQRLVDAAREAARERDQPAGVALQQLEVDAGLVVEALEVAEGDELDEVVVAGRRLGDQRQVGPVALVRRLLRAPVLDDVDLAADDRPDARLAREAVELDRAGHGAVVGERDGGHLQLGGPLDQLADAARPVEDRVLRVAVEVDEGTRHRSEDRTVGSRRTRRRADLSSSPPWTR